MLHKNGFQNWVVGLWILAAGLILPAWAQSAAQTGGAKPIEQRVGILRDDPSAALYRTPSPAEGTRSRGAFAGHIVYAYGEKDGWYQVRLPLQSPDEDDSWVSADGIVFRDQLPKQLGSRHFDGHVNSWPISHLVAVEKESNEATVYWFQRDGTCLTRIDAGREKRIQSSYKGMKIQMLCVGIVVPPNSGVVVIEGADGQILGGARYAYEAATMLDKPFQGVNEIHYVDGRVNAYDIARGWHWSCGEPWK